MDTIIIAILAAGASRRLGEPKQLVMIDGKPLLQRQCEVAIEAGIGAVAAILGSHAEACREVIDGLAVSVRLNPKWNDGLGSSIACAARAAGEASAAGVLILHCDQYAIAAIDLRTLYEVWIADRSKAVRSRSGSYLGPPVIFPASSFTDLRELTGDDGAKSVIARLGRANVVDVDIPSAADDLDTPEQLTKLR
jgi:molybdenum cofactor cytidylyltransferase